MQKLYKTHFSSILIAKILGLILMVLFTAEDGIAQSFPNGFSRVQVASGISKPTVLTFAPDGRIFIAEQGGKLRVLKNGNLLSTPFVSLGVNSSGERGLIGIALDPNFSSNQYIYLYYTLADGSRNRVSRFTANGDIVVPGSEVVLLNLDPLSSATNHNGGAMHFGTDGKLYVAVGDNANSSNAQNLDTYHGKILRINPDGSVPSGNPYASGSNQRRRVWAYGLRNPYTFDIQSGTGKVFVNDVGQNTWEEINNATTGGLNFGWPSAEGNSSNPAYTNPVFAYPHGSGDGKGCAITGGVFFNSSASNYPAEYQGRFFYLDYCNNWINMLDNNAANTRLPFATSAGSGMVSMEVGNDGNLYYLSRNDSRLYKIIYTNVSAPAITDQPDNVEVSAGQAASFSVSASGSSPLSYQWQKGGSNISGATSSTYSISNAALADAGNYRVIVSNSVGSVASNAAILTVTGFNAEPVPVILTPTEGVLYEAGSTITFTGDASDEEDGTLPASAFTWEVDFHHDVHTHDGPPVASGTKSGSFVIPNQGETADNVWYRLFLTVTDSEGLSASTYRDIYPQKSTLSFATVPAGLKVTLDGQPLTTPVSVVGVEGILRNIGVISPQTKDGTTYEFDYWQQGGEASQTITTPEDDVTYTAVFKQAGSVPAPWQNGDIGNVAAAGSAASSGSSFTVTGSGADIWNQSDEFHYVYQSLSGNGEIVGRVTQIDNTDEWAKAGFMFRESTAANAKHASVFVTPGQGVAFQRRTATGSASQHNGTSGSVPMWLKLSREGNTFTGFKSSDGSSWVQVGTVDISMGSEILLGLAVTAHNDGALSTAIFSNVSISGSIPFEPQTLEAETATLAGPQVASNHSGYTGSGFVDYVNSSGDYISWSAEVPSAGTYVLSFRYALGSNGNRPLEIKVNGNVAAASLSFTPTGSWTNWQSVSVSVALNAGTNTIRATAIGSSGANLDHLMIEQPGSNTNASLASMKKAIRPFDTSSALEVYPNPTADAVFIKKDVISEGTTFQLTDIHGRTIPIQISDHDWESMEIRLPGLKAGIYTLMMKSNERLLTEKIVVKP